MGGGDPVEVTPDRVPRKTNIEPTWCRGNTAISKVVVPGSIPGGGATEVASTPSQGGPRLKTNFIGVDDNGLPVLSTGGLHNRTSRWQEESGGRAEASARPER